MTIYIMALVLLCLVSFVLNGVYAGCRKYTLYADVIQLNVVAPSFLSSRCQSHFYFALNVMDAMNE